MVGLVVEQLSQPTWNRGIPKEFLPQAIDTGVEAATLSGHEGKGNFA